MAMAQYGKWQPVHKLGQGGQGTVFLAFDVEAAKLPIGDFEGLYRLFHDNIRSYAYQAEQAGGADRDKTVGLWPQDLAPLFSIAMRARFGALKVLRTDGKARDSKNSKERMRRELETYRQVSHPNLLRLLDENLEGGWFVTEYHANGTLNSEPGLFRGNVGRAIRVIRDLVEGVAALHGAGILHRDIKPENLFLASVDRLILGDMGLAFFPEGEETRLTGPFSNVGTKAWMPQWAMHVRVEDVRFTFDVYALGKVLWSMLTCDPQLPMAYKEGSIPSACNNSAESFLIEDIVRNCVVLEEADCIRDGTELLHRLDSVSTQIAYGCETSQFLMVQHAMSRPGPLSLFSFEAPKKRELPAHSPSSTTAKWMTNHPAFRGKGVRTPGVGVPDSTVLDEALWQEFLDKSPENGRYLIRPPDPRSFDIFLDVNFEPVLMEEARFLQLAIAVDQAVRFSVYVQLNPGGLWVAFSPALKALEEASDNEIGLPLVGLKRTSSVQQVVIDLRQAIAETWRKKSRQPTVIDLLRFRGAYKIHFGRIV